MPRPTVATMTSGQLKLHFASLCRYHRADGVRALGLVHRISTDDLRTHLLAYEAAAKVEDWKAGEDALLKIMDQINPATV